MTDKTNLCGFVCGRNEVKLDIRKQVLPNVTKPSLSLIYTNALNAHFQKLGELWQHSLCNPYSYNFQLYIPSPTGSWVKQVLGPQKQE